MKRLGILTAGGDTPALNATIREDNTAGNKRIRYLPEEAA